MKQLREDGKTDTTNFLFSERAEELAMEKKRELHKKIKETLKEDQPIFLPSEAEELAVYFYNKVQEALLPEEQLEFQQDIDEIITEEIQKEISKQERYRNRTTDEGAKAEIRLFLNILIEKTSRICSKKFKKHLLQKFSKLCETLESCDRGLVETLNNIREKGHESYRILNDIHYDDNREEETETEEERQKRNNEVLDAFEDRIRGLNTLKLKSATSHIEVCYEIFASFIKETAKNQSKEEAEEVGVLSSKI